MCDYEQRPFDCRSCYVRRVTLCFETLEECFSLSSQGAEIGLTAHTVMHRRADPQVIQQQPERWMHRWVPEVLAVLIQPCLDEDQQWAGETAVETLHFNHFGSTLSWSGTLEIKWTSVLFHLLFGFGFFSMKMQRLYIYLLW